jgi:class 3 adenylate cyclase
MSLFHSNGPAARRLLSLLRRRSRTSRKLREDLDRAAQRRFFAQRAIVFTDTADFTARVRRRGILHFLMLLNEVLPEARRLAARHGGRLLKVEADSFLMSFPEANAACGAAVALHRKLREHNQVRPFDEKLRFSFGLGYGRVLEVEDDVFGLEVNLASKLGEDLARPGEALLTPSAAANVSGTLRRQLVHCGSVSFGHEPIVVHRLKLSAR